MTNKRPFEYRIGNLSLPLIVLVGNLKFNLFIFILFSFCNTSTAQQFFTNPDELVEAVNNSVSGGTFIVRDGTYNDFEASIEIEAKVNNPIVIKAETVGGVSLTGESQFVFKKSAFITLQGFIFDCQGEETLVKLEGCNNIRITRNVFELETTEPIKWVFIGGFWSDNTFPFQFPSHHNRIDHNVFQNKETPGHYITVDGSFDDTGSDEVYYQSQYDRIDYNYFKNNGPRAVNEQESIRIGWSEMSQSSGFTTVEHNLFEDCDGDPEIVSVKSCDNIIRHNTFVSSYGTLSLRHGNRNRVEGNYFFGNGKEVGTSPAGSSLYTGGIRIYGTDHLIINNYMEGLNGTIWDAPIALTLGDAIDGQSSNLSKHFRAERVTIAFNTLVDNSHGVEIGFDNNGNYNIDLEEINIFNNLITGSENSLVEIVDTSNDQGDKISWVDNLFFPTGNAMTLQGATSTTFDLTEVVNENPHLIYDYIFGSWRSTEDTPLFENSVLMDEVGEDVDGQERPSMSNPGADHYSLESIRYRPLTAMDVGPDAYANDTTSITNTFKNSQTIFYPNPTTNVLYLKNIDRNINRIKVVTINGQVCIEKDIEDPTDGFSINISQLLNGIYAVQLSGREGVIESKAIFIHR